ncbi:MAG: hypothetical protein IPK53_17420 [bacterium]|nr:hypothetical protein [bacterium]
MNLDRVISLALAAGIAILYTAIIFAFFDGTDSENRLLYLAAIGVPLGIGFFAAPRVALYILGVLVYSVDWLAEYWQLLPREATWLVDIFVVLFAVRYGLTFFTAKHKVYTVEKVILVALVFAVLSALVNGERMATTMLGIRVGFRYVLLFLAAAGLYPEENTTARFVRFLFLIGLIQTPVILWQWQFTSWVSEDELNGTFGRSQTPGIALFMLTLWCYLIARMLEEKRIRPIYVVGMLWMIVAPVLGEAKFFFLLLPIFVAFMARTEFFRRPALAIGLSLIGVIMIIAVDYIIVETGFWREGRNPLTYVTKLDEVFRTELDRPQEGNFERSYRFMSAIVLATDNARTIFFGNGPGSVTMSYVAHEHSKTSAYYAGYGLTSSAPSIPWMLTEYGYVGTLLLLSILAFIFVRGRVLRSADTPDLRVYGRMLEGMVFLYVAWLFYQSAWQSDSMNFVFWPLAGMFVSLSYRVQSDRRYQAVLDRAQALKDSRAKPLFAQPGA